MSVTSKDSGIVGTHITKIQDVARDENTFIFVRPTEYDSTILIEAGYATKSMDVHHKSSNWGPMAGFVPCDPAFSKKCEGVPNPDENEHQHEAAYPTQLGLKPQLLGAHAKIEYKDGYRLVANPYSKGPSDAWVVARATPADATGQKKKMLDLRVKFETVQSNAPEHKFCTDNPAAMGGNKATLFCLIRKENLWMVYWVKWSEDKKTGHLHPLRVFAYKVNKTLSPVTGDYDLWMVAPHFKHFDDHVITRLQQDTHGSSAASGYTTRLLATLNAKCGRGDNPVFNHGAESQNYDFTQGLDHNLAMFTAAGTSRMVRMNQMPGILADLRGGGYLAVWNKRYGHTDARFSGKTVETVSVNGTTVDIAEVRRQLDAIYTELDGIRKTANPAAVAAAVKDTRKMPPVMQNEIAVMAQRFQTSRNYGHEQSRVYRFHRQLLDFLGAQLSVFRTLKKDDFDDRFRRYTAETRQMHTDLQSAMVQATTGKGETDEAVLRQWLDQHQAQIERLKEYFR